VDEFFNAKPTREGGEDVDEMDQEYMNKLLGEQDGAGYDIEQNTAGNRRIRGDIEMDNENGVYEGKRVSRARLYDKESASETSSYDS